MEIRGLMEGAAHTGIPSMDVERSRRFFEDLGFVTESEEKQPSGRPVIFMEMAGVILEVYEAEAPGTVGALEHLALETSDIEKVFKILEQSGHRALEGGISSLEFSTGKVRYFTVMGPDFEKIEFCQPAKRKEE